jgi:hypothetical protein
MRLRGGFGLGPGDAVGMAAFGLVKTVLNSRRARLILQPRQPGKGIEAEFSVSLHGDAP